MQCICCGRVKAVKAKSPRDRPWQNEFPGKEVHLDFSPLPAAIVDNAINTDGRGLGRPHRIGGRRYVGILKAVKFHMPEFVCDQKGMNELIASVLMQNEEDVRIKVARPPWSRTSPIGTFSTARSRRAASARTNA